jgi:hypothetical protein
MKLVADSGFVAASVMAPVNDTVTTAAEASAADGVNTQVTPLSGDESVPVTAAPSFTVNEAVVTFVTGSLNVTEIVELVRTPTVFAVGSVD